MSAVSLGYAAGRAAQVDALRTVAAEVPAALAGVGGLSRSSRLLLTGIGASYAALASPLWQLRAAGVRAFRSDCSDLPGALDGVADLAIAVSQSGRSRETTDVVHRLHSAGVPTLAITNSTDNPLQSVSAGGLRLGGFADSRVSTVGFVATYAALGMLVELVADGRVSEGWSRLADAVPDVVGAASPTLAAFAARHLATGAVDVVSSAAQATTAEAVALLFREGPLVPASAYGTRAYLHGPMDCAGLGVAHILIGDRREAQLARQLGEKTDGVLLVGPGELELGAGQSRVWVPAGLSPVQRSLVEVCVLQELVAQAAEIRGNPIDDIAFTRQDTKIDDVAEIV